jgi:23S rRNA-/tRNA-specific pseudouridylate synthase
MKEKRKAERLDDLKEVTITIISGEKNLTKGKKFINYSENISVSGAKIRANILLPVDTILQIDFTLELLEKQITALGKVKWVKVIFKDAWYEAGVEFVDTPDEAVKKIEDYISWKKKSISLKP